LIVIRIFSAAKAVEFIPIVKMIYKKKELEKTDTLTERINNSYEDLKKKIEDQIKQIEDDNIDINGLKAI
jgi:hypothetical protein